MNKTATVRIYQPYGASYWMADILYRNSVVWVAPHSDTRPSLVAMACGAAYSSGFKLVKIID